MSGEDAGKATVYHDRFLNYARSLSNNHHTAEDIVQSAYVKLIEYTEPIKNPYAFMMIVIRNKFLDTERAKQRSRIVDTLPLDDDMVVSPEKSEDISGIVMKTMAALPEMYRNVLVDFTNGLNYREIASRQGITPGTTRVRVSRARKMLREHLAEYALEADTLTWPRRDVA